MFTSPLTRIAGSLVIAFAMAIPVAAAPAGQPGDDVTVIAEAINAAPARLAAVTSPTSDCTDTAYALAKWRLTSIFNWSYNPANTPASVTYTALNAVRTGTQSVFAGRNRCGSTPTLTITEQYLGTTTRAAQVSSAGACTGNDGASVTSWGALPANVLGYTCTYYRTSTGAVLASDMLINNVSHQWFTTMPAGCQNKFDLQSVVTHERGHTVGLSHVDQATHALSTMSPKTRACDTTKRLFSSGDLAGITALYAR